MKSTSILLGLWLLSAAAPAFGAEASSRLNEITDPDTRAWWQATEALSNDAMEGRDVGSAGYDRAAALVAKRFAAAGLKPAGEDGTWFQLIKFDDWQITTKGTDIAVGTHPLRLLYDIFPHTSAGMPTTLDALMMFGGYCAADALGEARGKVVLCFGWSGTGLTSRADRTKAARQAGAVGLLDIADPGYTLEPTRWPMALCARGGGRGRAGTARRFTARRAAQRGCAGAGDRRLGA
jgi:hypothetical protein